ncbi:WD repeat-containing protein 87 [Balamuthia mandrillaris]
MEEKPRETTANYELHLRLQNRWMDEYAADAAQTSRWVLASRAEGGGGEDPLLGDFVRALVPVHSCSAFNFQSMLQRNGLFSRQRLTGTGTGTGTEKKEEIMNELTGELNPKTSVCLNLQEKYAAKFEPFLARKRCWRDQSRLMKDCESCKAQLYNLAEVAITKHKLGETRCIIIRQLRLRKYFRNVFSAQDFITIDNIALQIYHQSISASASSSPSASWTGIEYWVDEFLETDRRVFSVLGPNVDYGPISILFSRDLLQHPEMELVVNSSTTFLSGHTFRLRPWSPRHVQLKEERKKQEDGKVEAQDYERGTDTDVDYWLGYFVAKYNREGVRAQWHELKNRKESWTLAKLHANVPGWDTCFAREIGGQARMALTGQPIVIPPPHYLVEHYAHADESLGIIAASCYRPSSSSSSAYSRSNNRLPPPLHPGRVQTSDIVEWYLSEVDSHGRIEGLMPGHTSLRYIEHVLIAESVLTASLRALLQETFVEEDEEEGEGEEGQEEKEKEKGEKKQKKQSLWEKVVVVKDEKESEEWQRRYFLQRWKRETIHRLAEEVAMEEENGSKKRKRR